MSFRRSPPPFLTGKALTYYKPAAELGDRRTSQRLKGPMNNPAVAPGGLGSVVSRDPNGSGELSGKGGKDREGVIM